MIGSGSVAETRVRLGRVGDRRARHAGARTAMATSDDHCGEGDEDVEQRATVTLPRAAALQTMASRG